MPRNWKLKFVVYWDLLAMKTKVWSPLYLSLNATSDSCVCVCFVCFIALSSLYNYRTLAFSSSADSLSYAWCYSFPEHHRPTRAELFLPGLCSYAFGLRKGSYFSWFLFPMHEIGTYWFPIVYLRQTLNFQEPKRNNTQKGPNLSQTSLWMSASSWLWQPPGHYVNMADPLTSRSPNHNNNVPRNK